VGELKRCVIGIDGGGTKTHAIIVGIDGAVLAESTAGPSNIQSVGLKSAASTLFDLIDDVCRKAQCTPEGLQQVVLGLAGAGRASDRTELTSLILSIALKKKFSLKSLLIETDARVALEAAFAGAPGVVVIAGTGSIALYRTEEGSLLRAGGWGTLLGDEGSGYSIGRDALNAVMRQFDGRGEKTELTKKALGHFNVASVEELIPKIYHEHADIASFAPKVFEAVSSERDRVAHMVLVKNSTELVELVRVLTMKVRPKKKLPVALMGGLLESENVYSKMVKERVSHSLPQILIQKPKFPAALGATIIGLNAFR